MNDNDLIQTLTKIHSLADLKRIYEERHLSKLNLVFSDTEFKLDNFKFESKAAFLIEVVSRLKAIAKLDDKLGKIKLVNAKTIESEQLQDPNIYYVAGWSRRFNINSPLACPYRIGRDGTRKEVIDQYKKDLATELLTDPEADRIRYVRNLARKVKRGHDIILVSWCFPLKSHAEVIRNMIYYMIETGVV